MPDRFQITGYLSPNHEPRPEGCDIDMLLLHYTGMATGAAARARLCDPVAKVSAHYMIERDGQVFQLVPEQRRAWHAGVASWNGARDINDRSIGIELVNPGHEFGYISFPEAQMRSLIALAEDILARHPIPSHRVLGHSDVAPQRKQDPGELFDWPRLAASGLGIWPEPARAPNHTPDAAWFQRELAAIGYNLPIHGTWDTATCQVMTAFQRHFQPAATDQPPDRETAARLIGLRQRLDRRGATA